MWNIIMGIFIRLAVEGSNKCEESYGRLETTI